MFGFLAIQVLFSQGRWKKDDEQTEAIRSNTIAKMSLRITPPDDYT